MDRFGVPLLAVVMAAESQPKRQEIAHSCNGDRPSEKGRVVRLINVDLAARSDWSLALSPTGKAADTKKVAFHDRLQRPEAALGLLPYFNG